MMRNFTQVLAVALCPLWARSKHLRASGHFDHRKVAIIEVE